MAYDQLRFQKAQIVLVMSKVWTLSDLYLALLPPSYSKLLSAAAWPPLLLSWAAAFASTKSMSYLDKHFGRLYE
jgi:hypothetical protein